MSSEAPDPRTFDTWEDAFKYPIPVVRRLEQQLRSNANDNGERLRSLVGTSYRHLLGTAGRIIEMDTDMQHVESALGEMGQRCNSKAIDKLRVNFVKFEDRKKQQFRERASYVAQVAVLQSCPTIVSRLIRKGDSSLLAAKVVVISRLLHKNLSAPDDAPPFVDNLRDRLVNFREKLLHHVNRQLSDPASDTASLIDSMCAFSLATSSTPSDVLRHFHRVRLKAVSKHFSKGQQNPQRHILLALKLYVRTLRDTQAIFPKRLADALAKLKSHPLLQDKEVRALVEMNLEIHEEYISESVRNFTPWPRHDELTRTEAEKILKTWAKQALESLLDGMKKALSVQKDLKLLVEVRKETLEMWLTSSSRVPGLNAATVLDELRNAMITPLSNVLRSRAERLGDVVKQIDATLHEWSSDKPDTVHSLWDPSTTSIEFGDGAMTFRKTIVARTHGRTDSIDSVLTTYDNWAASISEASSIIKSIRDTRWDDYDIEEDDSDSDYEFGSLQTLLSQDDPLTLATTLGDALTKSFDSMRSELTSLISTLTSSDPSTGASQSIFVLRILREVSRRLSTLATPAVPNSTSKTPTIPSEILEPAYQHLATAVSRPALGTYSRAQRKQQQLDHAVTRELWDGSPALPLQISPATFKYLRKLNRGMSALGADLWGKTALEILKERLSKDTEDLLKEIVDKVKDQPDSEEERPETNGINGSEEKDDLKADDEEAKDEDDEIKDEHRHEEADRNDKVANPPPKTSEPSKPEVDRGAIRRDKFAQLCFDAVYLQRALSKGTGKGAKEMKPLEKVIRATTETGVLSPSEVERLQKGAGDYWKRTYLLFALIA